MLVIGTLPVSHLKTATMGNLDLGILGHVRSRNIDGRMNRMTWPPGLFQVVQQDGDVLLVFLAGVEIRRCLPLHLPWCLPNHQDHRPRRCHTRSQTNPTKAQSSESESSQGTVVFLKIYHNFFSVSSFTMVYSSWSMLTTWNRTSGAVQLTDSALIMFSKSEEKPSGLTSHGQKVHPKSEIKWNLCPPLSTCVPVVFWLVLGESKKTCTIQTMQSMALALKSTLHTKSCYPRQLEGWCGRCPLQLPANSLIIDSLTVLIVSKLYADSATHQTKTFKLSFWLRMRRWIKDDKGWRW